MLLVVLVSAGRSDDSRPRGPALSAGVVLAGAHLVSAGDRIPVGEVIEAKQASYLRASEVVVAAAEGARFRVLESRIELMELSLERGAVQVFAAEVQKTPSFEIVTTDVRVKFVAAEVWVEKTEGSTRVVVERGTATLWSKRGLLPVTVQAGGHYETPPVLSQPATAAKKCCSPRISPSSIHWVRT